MKIYQKTIFLLCLFLLTDCSGERPPQPGGPTEVLNSFVEASKTKDIETMKRSLSKGTMEMIEQSAKRNNTSVDELLKNEEGTLVREMPETRNEKIEGGAATLEVKNVETGEFDEIPFLNEGGTWRLALDQVIKELSEEETDEPTVDNTSGSNTSNSGNNAAPNGNSNNLETNRN